jgi:hypothetical protein
MSKKNTQTPSVAAPPSCAKEEVSPELVAEPAAQDRDTVVSGGQFPVRSSESAAKRAETERTLLEYAKTVGS